jgi:hypothetical protein
MIFYPAPQGWGEPLAGWAVLGPVSLGNGRIALGHERNDGIAVCFELVSTGAKGGSLKDWSFFPYPNCLKFR